MPSSCRTATPKSVDERAPIVGRRDSAKADFRNRSGSPADEGIANAEDRDGASAPARAPRESGSAGGGPLSPPRVRRGEGQLCALNAMEWSPWDMISVVAHYGHHDAACIHALGVIDAEASYAAMLAVRRDPAWEDPELRACLGAPMPHAQASWRRLKERHPLVWERLLESPHALARAIHAFGDDAWRAAPRSVQRAIRSALARSPHQHRRGGAVPRRLTAHPSSVPLDALAASHAPTRRPVDPAIMTWSLAQFGRDAWLRLPRARQRRVLAAVAWTAEAAADAAAICGHHAMLWRAAAHTIPSSIAYLRAVLHADGRVAPRLANAVARRVIGAPNAVLAVAALIGHHPILWRAIRRRPEDAARYLAAIGAERWARLPDDVRRDMLDALPPHTRQAAAVIAVVGLPSNLAADPEPHHIAVACQAAHGWERRLTADDWRRIWRVAARHPHSAAALGALLGDHPDVWRIVRRSPAAMMAWLNALGPAGRRRLSAARRRRIVRRWLALEAHPPDAATLQRMTDSVAVIGFHPRVWKIIAASSDVGPYLAAMARRIAPRLSAQARNAIAHGRAWAPRDAPLLAQVIGAHPTVVRLAHLNCSLIACLTAARHAGHIRLGDPQMDAALDSIPWDADLACEAARITGRLTSSMWRAGLARGAPATTALLHLIAHDAVAFSDETARTIMTSCPPPPLTLQTVPVIAALIGWNAAWHAWIPWNDSDLRRFWRRVFADALPTRADIELEVFIRAPAKRRRIFTRRRSVS